MASADLRHELTCSICLNIYTDPVTLPCGHSFCWPCTADVLDTQDGSGACKCPECRAEIQERPALEKNRKLSNIAESYQSAHPKVGILCTHCIQSPVPAAKTCLCEKRLKVHSKSAEHVLTEHTTSLGNRKEENEKRVQSLQEHKRQVQDKATREADGVTALISDIKKQLEAQEKRVLNEISRQEEQVSRRVSDLIRQLEIKKEDLSRKMGHIEELCNMTDPLTVLQGRESDRAEYCDAEEGDNGDTERHDIKDAGDLDVGLISLTLHSGLAGIVTGKAKQHHVPEASDMLLGVNTAGNDVIVSGDLKTVENHLMAQNKSAKHILTEATTTLVNRICSVHKKVLEYYCCEDMACICVSCSLSGEYKGHKVETLNEASEKKKEKLRNILQKMTSKREEVEKRVQSLQEHKRQVQDKATEATKGVAALIRDINKELEALEKRALSEISRQEEQVSLQVSNLIRQLDIKQEDLSRKMGHIEELYNMTDPLTVLQGQESDRADYCDAEEEDNKDTERHDIKVQDAGDLDVGLILVTLHSGLIGIVTRIKKQQSVREASDMLLDINTASNNVKVEEYGKDGVREYGETVSWSLTQNGPQKTKRFKDYPQVLSSRSFSSGRHYWEAEGDDSGGWEVGMAYPSIERSKAHSRIGYNKKSWSLWRWPGNDMYCVRHDSKLIQLPPAPSCCRLGIFLDYEVGRLSFYELCDPIRHLHTFTAAFKEPLHAIFWVYQDNAWVTFKG